MGRVICLYGNIIVGLRDCYFEAILVGQSMFKAIKNDESTRKGRKIGRAKGAFLESIYFFAPLQH